MTVGYAFQAVDKSGQGLRMCKFKGKRLRDFRIVGCQLGLHVCIKGDGYSRVKVLKEKD